VDGVQWIFGYGSLVWRPAFPYAERRAGYIRGFARRFWQHSSDHRGTPERPGRVVTLIEKADTICGGMGYRVEPDVLAEVVAQLDHREQNGYRRVVTPLYLEGAGERRVEALLYLAGPKNPHYAGPAPLEDIAAVIRSCRGPSGDNGEYVLELARALAELGYRDPHVEELARLLTPSRGV
jgi:glutathione-specific gamma-glutamylcyclotransferase